MQILPRTKREWLEVLSLALKTYVVVAAPCVFLCDHELAASLEGWSLHAAMREFVVPTQIGYFLIFLVLIWFGVSELSRRRYWRTMIDFIFAVVAFFCIYLLEPLAVKLR
jgi:hypothetical protein